MNDNMSMSEGYWEPHLARLNSQGKYNAWSTEVNNSWIQVCVVDVVLAYVHLFAALANCYLLTPGGLPAASRDQPGGHTGSQTDVPVPVCGQVLDLLQHRPAEVDLL